MTARVTLATAGRVLRQLRHDHRTIALMLLVPSVLITLLWWLYDERSPRVFDAVGAVLVCLFPFLVMFLVTSIATLRERTTGFDAAQKAAIAAHAEHIAIVIAPNMSVGVNVVLKLLDVAARSLAEGFDVEIVETHHRLKVDAPSGTALGIGEAAARGLGLSLAQAAVRDRDGEPRRAGTIGFASLRGGDVVGDHTALFAGTGERIEITHRATSRATYADGSLRAARFLAGRQAGLFGMAEVLGLAGSAP